MWIGRARRVVSQITMSIGLALLSGCMPPAPVPVPTRDALISALDAVIFDPNTNCEELRDLFGLDDLEVLETPAGLGLPYEGYLVPVDGDRQLAVWSIPAEDARGIVVLAAGSSGTRPCYLFVPSVLNRLGWSVVMYDYPGFGESTGQPHIDELGRDLQRIVDDTLQRFAADSVVLFGISLGAVPSMEVAVENPDTVAALILDSPLALGEQIRKLQRVFQENTEQVVSLLDRRLRAEELAVNLQAPLLVLAGDEDEVTGYESATLIYERAAGPATLITFRGAGHARGVFDDEEGYRNVISRFLADLPTAP